MPRSPASASSRLLAAVAAADTALLQAAARLRRADVDRAVAAFSRAGNYGVGWVALGAAVSVARRDPRPLLATAITVWGTLAVNYGVKQMVRRERPDLAEAPRAIEAPSSSSFPSSHAAMSAAGALALGVAVPKARRPLQVVALLMTYSRVHLAVHHPSDVVAGYALGAITSRAADVLVPARRRRGR